MSRSSECQGRYGRLETNHGTVETPIFMAVGTRGCVKGITPEQLRQAKVEMVLANTYHLMTRPGADVVEALGGLHRFMGWEGPILTDSGGFQVFSLEGLRRISDETDEVVFTSHVDGSLIRLSPAQVIAVQNQLGADIIMAFDECVKLPCEEERLKMAVERTIRWARQGLAAHKRKNQWLFGIVQGGTNKDLRTFCAEQLVEMDFPGYAIGGLSVGEGHEEMIATAAHTAEILPPEKPRYLMGVGTPRDLIKAIRVGIDMFDCAMPTRNGRNALAFVKDGKLRLRNEKYKTDDQPIDQTCHCYTCRNFSRGYLRHLILAKEMTGAILVAWHNLAFYEELMEQARRALKQDCYNQWAQQWLAQGQPTGQEEDEQEPEQVRTIDD